MGNLPAQYQNGRLTTNVYGNSNTNVGNVSHSYNNIVNIGGSDEKREIQDWLSPLEPHRRHQDVRNRRLDGIGEWVLGTPEFQSWLNSQGNPASRTLLCYGGQGVGKTYISSLIIDALRDMLRGQNAAVLLLYCDYQARKEQTLVNMIGGILRQIVARTTDIPEEIRRIYEESKESLGSRGLRLQEMVKLFGEVFRSVRQVFICIDAIDEIVARDRPEFLRVLSQILKTAPNVRLFLTGRSYIREELCRHLTAEAYLIPIVPDRQDIRRFISSKMDDDQDPELMSNDLRKLIMETILEKTSEMFLLVCLNIDAILGEITLAQRKKMVAKVAQTGVSLDDVYAETLQRIREQKGGRSRLGMEILKWISHSERPLRVDELCHALAVEVESTDLDPENIPAITTILSSCLGLVIFEKEASTVRLNHFTLQEYLSGHGIFPGGHLTLAETCLTYLNLQMVRNLSPVLGSPPQTTPFLEYASVHWGKHARGGDARKVIALALKLLDQCNKHISTKLLCVNDNFFSEDLGLRYRPGGFNGLHCLAFHGTTEIVVALKATEMWEVNSSDFTGSTPLVWAAKRGHEEMVALLLSQRDIVPDLPDEKGQTALSWAAVRGHAAVVRQLLARGDVNINSTTQSGQTPLFLASSEGHKDVVALLLDRNDINPNLADKVQGRTPISIAASRGYDEVVKLLLGQKGVAPDMEDRKGRTPLLWAALVGHEEVAKLLLGCRDVNPEVKDKNGRTASELAALSGRQEVMDLFRR